MKKKSQAGRVKVLGFVNKSEIRFTQKPLGVAERARTGLLAALGFGGRFFTLKVISAPSALLYFIGLLTHGELLPLY
ncbi:MAG: hypothetical protein HOK62_02575 [Verrucomicrobiales bacterium]|nr:hypothetical protein [Verrucomicrobiales bacterium]